MIEFIFEFIIEGVSEIINSLKMHPVIRIIILTISILAFSALFIWIMSKLGVWK